MEVTNKFKGLDLLDRVPEELWTEVHDIVQETRIKTMPKKKILMRRLDSLEKTLMLGGIGGRRRRG